MAGRKPHRTTSLTLSLGITLTAKTFPEDSCVPSKTTPNAPRPSSLPSLYFSSTSSSLSTRVRGVWSSDWEAFLAPKPDIAFKALRRGSCSAGRLACHPARRTWKNKQEALTTIHWISPYNSGYKFSYESFDFECAQNQNGNENTLLVRSRARICPYTKRKSHVLRERSKMAHRGKVQKVMVQPIVSLLNPPQSSEILCIAKCAEAVLFSSVLTSVCM